MGFFHKKKEEAVLTYDQDKQRPVIRCSICTGEQVAGFQDKETGRFDEVMLIRNPEDLESFKKKYGVDTVTKIY